MVMFPADPSVALGGASRWDTVSVGYVVSVRGGYHGVSLGATVSIPEVTAFASGGEGYGLQGFRESAPRSLTYNAGDGTYWLAGRLSPAWQGAGWTPVEGTHYAWIKQATLPTVVSGLVLLLQVTVSGGAITAVLDQAHRMLTGLEVVDSSRTVGNLAVWRVAPGSRIQPASGVTLTMYGQLEAGRYPIVDLSLGGVITYPRGATLLAEWYGACADDATESGAAIGKALSATGGKMIVSLGPGVYRIGQTILSALGVAPYQPDHGWGLTGAGKLATTLRRADGFVQPLLQIGQETPTAYNSNYWEVSDLTFEGVDRASGSVGLRNVRGNEGVIRNCYIQNFDIGLHSTFAIIVEYHNTDFRNNNTGLLQENSVSGGATVHKFIGCRFRNNLVVGLDIDGTRGGGLLRDFLFLATAFEGHANTSGTDIGVRLRKAEQMHFKACWFEANSHHLVISGGDQVYPVRYITIEGGNFGQLNDNALDLVACHFTGTYVDDGLGCWLRNVWMNTGTYQFDQARPVEIDATLPLGGGPDAAVLAGNYIQRNNVYLRRGGTGRSWIMERWYKTLDDESLLYIDRRLLTTETTSTVPAVLILFDDENAMPLDGTLYVQAEVVAKATDNTQQAAWQISGLFKNVAGVASEVAPEQELATALKSGGAAAWDAHFDVVAGDARLVITGGALPVQWSARLTTHRLPPPPAAGTFAVSADTRSSLPDTARAVLLADAAARLAAGG